ncbi:MAG: filamentous hemagglutinin N-terminal protein, partial [Burkholderiales bacterium]|nr:filamentous hemagglutinin N-terminal protein [Burkholderiales bacterium]
MQPKRASFKQHAIAFAVVAAFQPQQLLAQTMPSGGQVAAGQATISHFTPSYLQVDQASDKAILNWQSFSIGAGGQVQFVQPSSTSVALNRVLGNNPSQIFGNLGANGRVFLVNPSGILFGPGSSVNVGALVASTLSITDDDFLAGRYTFSNAGGAGSILNQGNLFSHSGYTALLAPQVTNEGFIFANMGNVALAAGDRVSLDMVGDNLIRVSVEQAALNAAVV